MPIRRTLFVMLLVLAFAACDRPEATTVEESEPIRIVSLNIWHDQSDWQGRLSLMVDTLRSLRPDVICLQEVLEHESLPNQARSIADSLGYNHFFSSVDSMGRERRYGNAILVRTAIEDTTWKPLEPMDDYRNVGHVRTTIRDAALDVYCTHLHHTEGDSGAAVRQRQVDDLVSFVDSTRAGDAAIVAGDFNAEPGGDEFLPLLSSFDDAFAAVSGDAQRPTTLNPYIGHRDRWIDYVFVERGSALRVRDVRRILDSPDQDGLWASDHFGVMVDVEWVPPRR